MSNINALNVIDLKSHPKYNEESVESFIVENLKSLGLGSLTLVSRQKGQDKGITDLICDNDTGSVRYIIEIQLGELDPSHIIRLIEYWDYERKQSPDKEYRAVIIAEKFSRYLNILSLLQATMPIIALQMVSVLQNTNDVGLFFTKILTYSEKRTTIDNEPKTRSFWETKTTKENLAIVDSIFQLLLDVNKSEKFDHKFELNYVKSYIGLFEDGISRTFIHFKPSKTQGVYMVVPETIFSDDLLNQMNKSGFTPSGKYIWIKSKHLENDANKDVLREVIKLSYIESH
jgi:hypothetical protein